jgi:hypothetical protein
MVASAVSPITRTRVTAALGYTPLESTDSAVYTWAGKPAAGTAGRQIAVSDVGQNGGFWRDTGTKWVPVSGKLVLAAPDTTSSSVGAADTVVFSELLPAALLAVGDRLHLRLSVSKSGTTDVGRLIVRVGTAGTTADTIVWNGNAFLAAANRSTGVDIDLRVESATTMVALPNSAATNVSVGYSTVSNNAVAAAVTISNVSNALYVSVSILSAGATDTVALREAQLEFIASAS